MSARIQQVRLESGREPTSEELAERLGASVEEIERLLQLRDGVLSLDAQEDEDDTPLVETITEFGVKSPRDVAAESQMRKKVERVMDYLGEREKRVLALRFGFESGRTLSLRRTSKIVGLSHEGVRRIEQRALGKLRRPALQRMVAGLV
jgi:RNA polymerase primary sigma factor